MLFSGVIGERIKNILSSFSLTGIAVAISFALGAASGWVVRGWKADSAQLTMERKAAKVRAAQDSAVAAQAEGYEKVRTVMGPLRTETYSTIREIYRDKEVPASCAVPPAGTRLLDTSIAVANAATAGQLEPTMSAAAKAPGTIQ